MADKPEEGVTGFQAFLILVAIMAGLGALWWYSGGPSRADLRGIFLQPPPPVGTGESYGPDPLKEPQQPYEYNQNYQAPNTY